MTNRYVLHPLFNNWVFRNKIRTIIPHAGWSDHQLDQYRDSYSESSNAPINKTCLSEYVRPLINSNLLKGKENTRNNHQVLVVRESNSNNQEFKEGSASVFKKQEICKKNKGSGMKVVHKIKGMNDAAKLRLSCYPDVIVEYACRRLLVKNQMGMRISTLQRYVSIEHKSSRFVLMP